MGVFRTICRNITAIALATAFSLLPGHDFQSKIEYKEIREFFAYGTAAAELKTTLGNSFDVLQLPIYNDLLETYGSDAIKVAKLVPNTLDTLDYSQLEMILTNYDSLESIQEGLDRSLTDEDLSDYEFFSYLGFSDDFVLEFVQQDTEKKQEIKSEFSDGTNLYVPFELVQSFVVDPTEYHASLFSDTGEVKQLQDQIYNQLTQLEHTYSTATLFGGKPAHPSDPSQIYRIDDGVELQTIQAYLGFLSNQDNVDLIGEMIFADANDKTTEHGGMIRFNNGIQLYPIDSISREDYWTSPEGSPTRLLVFTSDESFAPYFSMPVCERIREGVNMFVDDDNYLIRDELELYEWASANKEDIRTCSAVNDENVLYSRHYSDAIGTYHFHITNGDLEACSRHARPSGGMDPVRMGDIGLLFSDHGLANDNAVSVVFTRLPGSQFNADAYTIIDRDEETFAVVDIGNYEFDVVDSL